MPAITLREVIAELASGARIVADEDNRYELQYPGAPITSHMLNHELVRAGWVQSNPNGGSYRLTDAGRLAYMRSTDELGTGELVPPHGVKGTHNSEGNNHG